MSRQLLQSILVTSTLLASGAPLHTFGNEADASDSTLLARAQSLRNEGRFEEALQALGTAVAPTSPRTLQGTRRALVLTRGMLLAETGHTSEAAQIATEALEIEPDAIDVNLAAAYIYRLSSNPSAALAASQRVLSQQPDNAEAYQHQVFALNDLRSPSRALALAEARPNLFSDTEIIYLRDQQAAQQVRWAESAEDFSAEQIAQSFAASDHALALLSELSTQMPNAQDHQLRNQRDLILALRQRERMTDAIEQYEKLEQIDNNIPPYAMEAAADAYLYDLQPRKAAALYERILEQDPNNYNASFALYWALVESEHFEEAFEHIDALAAETPMFQAGQPYWDRLYIDSTAAMGRAMANQPADAEKRLLELLQDAPASALLRRELATVYLWRQQPNRALEQAEIALAYEPKVLDSRLTYASALMGLERYEEADEQLEAISQAHPQDRIIQREHAQLHDRDRWRLSTQAEYGDSSGYQQYGSYDRSLTTRLDAPWMSNWRPYISHYYSDSGFPESSDDVSYERMAAGIDWSRYRHHLYAEVSRSIDGRSESGLTLGYNVSLGDHWRFSARHEHFSTQVPLRAREEGLDGNYSEITAGWQPHESFNTSLGISHLSISDGNDRISALFSAEQRLFASAHHITTGRLELYGAKASQEGGSYFNPERDASALLGLNHEWLTWRHYDRSFTQRFGISAGSYWQKGYGSNAIGNLSYEHEWYLTRTTMLRYGIGLSSNVYDGNRERRLSGVLALEVLF